MTASRRTIRGELEATVDRICTLWKTFELEEELDRLVETTTTLDVTGLFGLVSPLLLQVPQTEAVRGVFWDRVDVLAIKGCNLEEVAWRRRDHVRRH